MWCKVTTLLILFLIVIPVEGAQKKGISIIKPGNKAYVERELTVEGTVTDRNAQVWIIVHPYGVNEYWVQPTGTVTKDGKWSAAIYVGRQGDIDVKRQFEIMAVANPRKKIKDGDVLKRWPKSRWRSKIIHVTRK